MGGGMGGGGGGGSYRGLAQSYRHREEGIEGRRLAPGTAKRVFSYARPYTWQVVWFLLIVVVSAAMVVASPLLLQRIIDDGVLEGDRRLVVILAIAVGLVALAEGALRIAQRWLSVKIGEGLIFDLRTEVFTHVQRQSVAFFSKSQTGALVTRLNSDVIGAQQAFTSTLSSVVSNVVTLAVVLGTLLALSWQITLLALAIVPLFFLPARSVGKRLAALTRNGMQLNAELGSRMTERFNVAGATLVTLFGDRGRESEQFAERAAQVRDINVRTTMSSAVFFTALGSLVSFATAVVYGVGGIFAIDGALTVGTLVAFTGLLGRLYGPVTSLTTVQVEVMTALVSFERVFEVLDLTPSVADAPDAVDLPDRPLGVELDAVTFAYPEIATLASLEVRGPAAEGADGADAAAHPVADRIVLHDLTLAVPPGGMLALVGPSGAGKTTIASLVARLYDPQGGLVRVGGLDVREVRLDSLHGAVGMVTQEAHMFHDTVRGNLEFASPRADDAAMWEALRAAQVADVVAGLPDGLDTVVGERGHRLSGGEKQRLAIARMLLRAPRVVVLDEATAHLDSASEAAVQTALDAAMTGRTSIVIAHRLATVRRADAIAVLVAGRVMELGTHAELLERGGVYADLHATQFGG